MPHSQPPLSRHTPATLPSPPTTCGAGRCREQCSGFQAEDHPPCTSCPAPRLSSGAACSLVRCGRAMPVCPRFRLVPRPLQVLALPTEQALVYSPVQPMWGLGGSMNRTCVWWWSNVRGWGEGSGVRWDLRAGEMLLLPPPPFRRRAALQPGVAGPGTAHGTMPSAAPGTCRFASFRSRPSSSSSGALAPWCPAWRSPSGPPCCLCCPTWRPPPSASVRGRALSKGWAEDF